MKEYTTELMKINTDQSLVLWAKPSGTKEFVVCTDYNAEKPVGSQWCWGHYFRNLMDAVNYANELIKN